MSHKVPLTLTGKQLHRLSLGHAVQLKPEQLQNKQHWINVHPMMAAKLHKAALKGAGCRLTMMTPEIEASGEGLRDIWHWVSKKAIPAVVSAAKFVKKNVIDTPLYQSTVKPAIRAAVESRLPQAMIPAFEAVGDQTGAFGIIRTRKPIPLPKPKPKSITNVVLTTKPKKSERKTVKGGSFLI